MSTIDKKKIKPKRRFDHKLLDECMTRDEAAAKEAGFAFEFWIYTSKAKTLTIHTASCENKTTC